MSLTSIQDNPLEREMGLNLFKNKRSRAARTSVPREQDTNSEFACIAARNAYLHDALRPGAPSATRQHPHVRENCTPSPGENPSGSYRCSLQRKSQLQPNGSQPSLTGQQSQPYRQSLSSHIQSLEKTKRRESTERWVRSLATDNGDLQ